MKRVKTDNVILKNYWLWVAVILIAAASLSYLRVDLKQPSAQLVINFQNGQTRKFEGPVISGMTALEALHAASLSGNFKLEYSINNDGGVNLASIDKFINSSFKSWHFYLNRNPIPITGLNKKIVKPGDMLEVKYE